MNSIPYYFKLDDRINCEIVTIVNAYMLACREPKYVKLSNMLVVNM